MRNTLGTAIAFPLRPDGRGGLALASGVDAVEDSLRAIIESMKGSHVMEPWLGLPPFAFQPIDDVVAIGVIIRGAIIDAEDRVDPNELEVEVDDLQLDQGFIPVAVSYKIKGEATTRTLQHGFRTLG